MSGTPRMDACECRFSTLFHPEDSMWVPSVKAKELERELSEANEYARKLSPKVEDQGRDIERLQATLQRKQDAGDLLFEELDDKTPKADCKCFEFCPCYDCDIHGRSRYALDEWKATETTTKTIVRYVEEVNGGMGPDYAEIYLTTGHVIQVNDEGLILWPSVAAYQSGENDRIAGSLTFENKEANK